MKFFSLLEGFSFEVGGFVLKNLFFATEVFDV
jgi:hypothetical protein